MNATAPAEDIDTALARHMPQGSVTDGLRELGCPIVDEPAPSAPSPRLSASSALVAELEDINAALARHMPPASAPDAARAIDDR